MTSTARLLAFEAVAKAVADPRSAEQAAVDLLSGTESGDTPAAVVALLDAAVLAASAHGRERAAKLLGRAVAALADRLVGDAVAGVYAATAAPPPPSPDELQARAEGITKSRR